MLMLGLGFIILLISLVVFNVMFIGWLLRNERFAKNGIKAYGSVVSSMPTGVSIATIPQKIITLKYTIDGKSYDGYATLFTRRIYHLNVVVPIRVNPKNMYECSLVLTKHD